jgi:endonuclease YncB( thermonuclease family)
MKKCIGLCKVAGFHYLVFMNPWPRYLLSVFVASSMPLAHADFIGKVVAVTDGDTIKVLDDKRLQYKVRLTGIDAPEKAQPFGNASRKHLASLVAGKEVLVETVKSDRYGRVLGKIWVKPGDCTDCGKTLDVNHAQILAGMAWWYQDYAKDQPVADRELYKKAVGEARERKLGLWSEANAIPPWAWRRGQRTRTVAAVAADFQCGTKRYCREMTSCEEAKFHLRNCGRSSLDGDGDGVPCESICR